MHAEKDDLIRVIGTFNKYNKYTLILDDNDIEDGDETFKAKMIIVEPFILQPTTTIVNVNPCSRRAILSS